MIVAFCSLSIALLTFFVVYNLFLDLVGHQAEMIGSFRHSHDATLRAHVNLTLARGPVLFLPLLTVLGGVFGFLGGMVGNLLGYLRGLLSAGSGS